MDTPAIDSYISLGWKMSEFSKWISYKEKDNFYKILGTENFIVLDELDAKFQKKWKAKMLISPKGMSILQLYFMPVAGTA